MGMRQVRELALVLGFALCLPQSLLAWGECGHKIVGQIAQRYLSASAQTEVSALIGERSLADVSVWADDVKGDVHFSWSRPYHYINVPAQADGVDMLRDCPQQGCVLQALIKYCNILRNSHAGAVERAQALMFVVHFVADVHQPLHVGRLEDRGGNDISVTVGGRQTNLHFVWDISLLQSRNHSWITYADELGARITDDMLREWSTPDILQWANESHRLCDELAYDVPPDGVIDEQYTNRVLPVLERRLSMAGVRLAALLNAVFDSTELPFEDLASQYGQPQLVQGTWRALLECPGGELPFGLEIGHDGKQWVAFIQNGQERITVPQATYHNGELTLDIAHYDSSIRARTTADGARLQGTWRKRIGPDSWAQLPFTAEAGDMPRFKSYAYGRRKDESSRLEGLWAVQFSRSEYPAIGRFEAEPSGEVLGTFMTPTGDYRYLAGLFEKNHLRLSTFDGAHAFLFEAYLQPDGMLHGDFWSRDSWHETWTAQKDANARLPDAFSLTSAVPGVDLSELVFSDLDGRPTALDDPRFAGKARIIEIFGSWCPNCHDSMRLLAELDTRYRGYGLSITGLAFELTGDFQRDAAQVQKFAKRHNVQFPILIAGKADKDTASSQLPMLDRLRSYPTTLFIDANGQIKKLHTGFAGPATGEEHARLRREFELTIEDMLGLKHP